MYLELNNGHIFCTEIRILIPGSRDISQKLRQTKCLLFNFWMIRVQDIDFNFDFNIQNVALSLNFPAISIKNMKGFFNIKHLNWKGIQCFTWLCPFIKIWNLEIDLEYSKSIFDYSRKICTVFLGHVEYLVISFLKRTLLSKIICVFLWLMTNFRISEKSFISMEKIYMYHFHIL